MSTKEFQQFIREFYAQNKRSFPWRETYDPYAILVSELMLQQTQTLRVVPKYQAWLELFPTVNDLAMAPISKVLGAWSGLGYNRRARFLWLAAQKIVSEFQGSIPKTEKELRTLPGIGEYTANAVLAFAYSLPAILVETNIRTVIIHHFLKDQPDITDTTIKELVVKTLPDYDIRDWYYALMDYGSFLKSTGVKYFKQIKGHTPQSKFRGSKRFVRGQILKELSRLQSFGKAPIIHLPIIIPGYDEATVNTIITDLEKEGFISKKGNIIMFPESTV